MDEDILGMLLGALVVFVPVAGLTIRFALKPVVESIARLMEARTAAATNELLERRLTLFEQELHVIRTEVRQLGERIEFDGQLRAGRAEEPVRQLHG